MRRRGKFLAFIIIINLFPHMEGCLCSARHLKGYRLPVQKGAKKICAKRRIIYRFNYFGDYMLCATTYHKTMLEGFTIKAASYYLFWYMVQIL